MVPAVKEFRQKAYLPTLAKWKQHDTAHPTIQPIHLEHMLEVLTAIRERRGLPGTLDVQRFFSFEEIKSYIEANNEKQHYSVAVIDYLGNMQPVTKDARDSKAAWEALSKDVLRWTAEKNVVTITPSQVNREANKGAKKKDASGYDLNSLYDSLGSALQKDAHLVMSVFCTDDMREMSKMQVKCLKHRGTEMFYEHILELDERSKYVAD